MKKLLAAAVLAATVSALLLWFAGRPAYRHYQETRAVARAKKALETGDGRNASLSARQALQINPQNEEACAVMARLAEAARAPQALDWRRRIVEIAPSRENKLLLASAALRQQGPPYAIAAQTLVEIAVACQDVPMFHVLSAELNLKLKRMTEAEHHFEIASRLEPANGLHRLNLGALRLNSTNETTAAEARNALEALEKNPALAPIALRWLIGDRLAKKDTGKALRLSAQLLALPQSSLADRLQHLGLLEQAKSPGTESFLAGIRKSAETNASRVYAVSAWLIGHDRAADALDWITHCPPQVQQTQPAPLARVDCHMAMKDWEGLENFLQGAEWEDLEFMRLAFLSQAAAARHEAIAADAQWRLALHAAGDRLGPLQSLLAMASEWGRGEVRENLMWSIVQKFPGERAIVRELDAVYTAAGNTRGLQKLYARLAAQDVKNIAARNNFAATSMLLQLNLPQAYETARELFQGHARDPVIASTYAYSLHLQGKTAEALAVMAKLPGEALESSSVALYYGVLLAAAGETHNASRFLGLVSPARLLPEEKQLWQQANTASPARH